MHRQVIVIECVLEEIGCSSSFISKNSNTNIFIRQKQLSFANYLTMLAVVFAIVSGMEAFLMTQNYPPDEQQFLNGVAPNTVALLTGNGSYASMTDPIQVAGFIDLVGSLD